MKVLISTDAVGGVWDYAITLATELREHGHETLLAAVGSPAPGRLAQLPDGVEVISRAYRLEWMPDAAADVKAAGEWLSEVAGLWGADVVHLNQMAYGAREFGAPKIVVVHSDVLSWFSEVQGTEAPPEWQAYATWVGRGLAGADVVVTPSMYQSKLAERHYGRGADRVIHNGARPPASEPARRTEPLVVAAGRAWDEAKAMSVLDAAAGRLGAGAPPVHVIGEVDGPRGEHFTARHALAHGRLERSEVDDWMSRASIYVGTSLYEPFGLAPLEAALRGCALVLSDLESFREIWDGCAVYYPAGDDEALAHELAELAPDLARCAQLGNAARTRALRRYTAERFTTAYLELYADVHGRSSAREEAFRIAASG